MLSKVLENRRYSWYDYNDGVVMKVNRNIEIDALALSDSAVEVLKNKTLNNRSHVDFQQLRI